MPPPSWSHGENIRRQLRGHCPDGLRACGMWAMDSLRGYVRAKKPLADSNPYQAGYLAKQAPCIEDP